MAKPTVSLVTVAAIAASTLALSEPASAAFYSGQISAGSTDTFFQIGPTSNVTIDISAIGERDPTICASCNSTYTDNYTVVLLNQSGTVLSSVNETNYLYYNMYTSSHGIGAGPVSINVPAGATTLEIQSQLSIAGLLGPDGQSLGVGELTIGSNGAVAAATPIPTTLPLFLSGLLGLLIFRWRSAKTGKLTASI
jgi:hypothetical protein